MGSDGGKIKNRGRFDDKVRERVSVAEQQIQAPKAPNSFARKGNGKLPVRAILFFGFAALALMACAGLGWSVVTSIAADLAEVAFGAVFLAATVTMHGFTTWWCVKNKPGVVALAVAQVPFLLLYVMTWIWFKVGFYASKGGPPSLWYLPWAALASISLSWLILYWIRAEKSPRVSKLFASALAVWLAVNGGGFAADRWNATNGYGLKGYPTPGDAFVAFTANSCVFDNDWYRKGGKSFEAPCAKYSQHDDNGPAPDFDTVISEDQPRETLVRWWQATRKFRQLQPLNIMTLSKDVRGDTATFTVKVASKHWPNIDGLESYHCFPHGSEETWTVHLETVAFGGWKVARVDVDRAATVVPYIGSACDRRT